MTHPNFRGSGADNPRSKMTNEDAQQMRLLRAMGYTYQQLQEAFGVAPATVHACVKGFSYKNAGGPREAVTRGYRMSLYAGVSPLPSKLLKG